MMKPFNNNPRKREKKEYERMETIIMPGIENGVIPTHILPKDMAGVMTKFYEKIFPPEIAKRILHIGVIALFLLFLFILFPFAPLIFKILRIVLKQ